MRKFGPLKLYKNKPTIIAEAGVNHECNLSLALKYIKLAKEAGVDAVLTDYPLEWQKAIHLKKM